MNYYKLLSRKIHTARSFHWSDWGILVRAWLELLYVDILLRTQPFPRVRQAVMVHRNETRQIPSDQAWQIIRRYQRLVGVASHYHLYPMECLRQALTLQAMLAGQGIATLLRFGVRKETGRLFAHAWLDYESESIELDHSVTERFEPLLGLDDGA